MKITRFDACRRELRLATIPPVDSTGVSSETQRRRLDPAEVVTAMRERRAIGPSAAQFEEDPVAPVVDASVIEAILRDPEHDALGYFLLRRTVIEGDLDLTYLRWTGPLGFVDCVITGRVLLNRARVTGMVRFNGSRVVALHAFGTHIDGSLELKRGFVAQQGLVAGQLFVAGSLHLPDAHLTAPRDKPDRAALDIYRAQIGDVFAARATLEGGLYAVGATIDRNLRLQGATVRSREACGMTHGADAGPGVGLSSSSIGGAVFLSGTAGDVSVAGSISLAGTTCHRFVASRAVLASTTLDLADFTYERLGKAEWRPLLDHLEAQKTFEPTAYRQLAAYLRHRGDLGESIKVEIALQRRYTRGRPWTTWEGLWHRVVGLTVQYGYRPGRALLWLLVAFVVASGAIAVHPEVFVYTGDGPPVPHSDLAWTQVVGLGLDTVVPLVQLGVPDWGLNTGDPSQWPWLTLLLALKVLGWALALLAAGSVSGVIRRA